MKIDIEQLLSQLCMETIFMDLENSKTNEPHKCVLNLSQRLDLKSSNKHIALENFIHLLHVENIGKRIRTKKPKNNSSSNDELELPDGLK